MKADKSFIDTLQVQSGLKLVGKYYYVTCRLFTEIYTYDEET